MKIYIKKTTENKALRGNSPQNPPHEGSTAGSCVRAIVFNNILYIHNIELALSPKITFQLGIFGVVQFHLYEWNWMQMNYKI
jgi:hypothetical protein